MRNVKIILLVLTALLVIPVWSSAKSKKGSNVMELRTAIRQVSNYSSLTVNVTRGPERVIVEGPEDVIRHILVRMSGRNLMISISDGAKKLNLTGVTIRVSGKEISSLNVFGSGDIRCSRLDAGVGALQNFGSGDLSVDEVSTTKLTVNQYGSGDVSVGKADCNRADINSQGSGDVKIDMLASVNADMLLQGSGDVDVKKVNSNVIRVMNQGSGDVRFAGSATNVTLTGQGSGDIIATGLNAGRITKVRQGSGTVRD